MSNNDFFKFPSTPHIMLSGELQMRNEKVLDINICNEILSKSITVEEKIDGANLGISFSDDGECLLQNRGQYLVTPLSGQWAKLQDWLEPKLNSLFDFLGNQYILFGEWCWFKHTVFYDALPDWFIAFDIFDKNAKKFLSVTRRNKMIDKMKLIVVPRLYFGHLHLDNIEVMLQKSRFGSEMCEGLYFRSDNENWLEFRAKYVNPSFVQTIDQHWSKKMRVKNRLSMNEGTGAEV